MADLERSVARTGGKPGEPQTKRPSGRDGSENSRDLKLFKCALECEGQRAQIGARKQEAAQTLARLYVIGSSRREQGLRIETGPWLHVLAATLDSVPPEITLADGSTFRTEWCGLSLKTLETAAIKAGLIDPNEFESLDLDRLDREIGVRRQKNRHKPMKKETIAKMLKITAEERIRCEAWKLHAIDETLEERKERKRREKVAKQREKRRSAGVKVRPPSKRSLWEAAGVSKSTYRRREIAKAKHKGQASLNPSVRTSNAEPECAHLN